MNVTCKKCDDTMISLYYHTSKPDAKKKTRHTTINVKTDLVFCRSCENVQKRKVV